ncbi:MAG: alpha/beta hydrolase [Marinobacter sp.]|nr:alpha/beta hydrolase [Marinobacter sp.]
MTRISSAGHWDRVLTLEDGRTLAFTEFGDPRGYPILFGHGMPGSRLEGRFFDEKGKEHGFRILTPDRPGIGNSDFQPRRKLLDYPGDIKQLADSLELEHFCHIGWSSGGSRTLACCYKLADRVDLGVCLSGLTHFSEYPGSGGLLQATRWPGPQLARVSPRLTRLTVNFIAWLSRRHPGLYLKSAEEMASRHDRQILQELLNEGEFRRDQLMCLNSGGRAITTDLLTELGDWGFRLRDIRTPVFIYHGEEDPFVPLDYARHLANNLPNAELTLIPGIGHLYPVSREFQDQLFQRLTLQLDSGYTKEPPTSS